MLTYRNILTSKWKSGWLGSSGFLINVVKVQEVFTLFGTTSRCLSIQPFQMLPLRNISRHISNLAFPHRYRHADVTELFPWFCCWTLIRLLRHWAWLRWGYWRYRSLIDWLKWPFSKGNLLILTVSRTFEGPGISWCMRMCLSTSKELTNYTGQVYIVRYFL